MLKYILLYCLTFSIGGPAFSNQSYVNPEPKKTGDTTKYKEAYKNILKEMDPSMIGKTAQGNKYNLYAIKRGRKWTYLILDSTGYYSVKQESKKSGMVENSQSHTEMLCMLAESKLLNKVNKPKVVSDLTLLCYYKFHISAKKTYRSFNKMEREAKFFKKNLQGGSKGINNILKKELK